jgi:hypothetical protein
LHYWDGKSERCQFNGRQSQAPAAPRWAIRLGYHAGEQVMPRQHLQYWDGEVRGTHKDDTRLMNHISILLPFKEKVNATLMKTDG